MSTNLIMCETVVGNENSHACNVFMCVCVPWEQCVGPDGALSEDGFVHHAQVHLNHMILMLGEASWHGTHSHTNTKPHTHTRLFTHSHSLPKILVLID